MIQTALGTYDPELQMFVEPEADLNQGILEMWRKRVERAALARLAEQAAKQESN